MSIPLLIVHPLYLQYSPFDACFPRAHASTLVTSLMHVNNTSHIKNSQWLEAVNFFHKAFHFMFDRILNRPL